MPLHTTIYGRDISYDSGSDQVEQFLRRLKAAANDAEVSHDQMIALVYGPENPILDHQMAPGRSMVTKEVLGSPLYKVMTDLLGLKQVNLGLLDLEKIRASYTLDVAAVAGRIGKTVQAVRNMIESDRLPGLWHKGQWWVNPESLTRLIESESIQVKAENQPVEFNMGSVPGASMSIRCFGGELVIQGKKSNLVHGKFPAKWERAVVKTTTDDGARAFELLPDMGPGELKHKDMWIRGPFRVSKKVNRNAQEFWASGR